MVKYNKNILKEEEDIFTHIEKKYGKIKTYNKKELDEISKYNELNLDIKFINKNNNIKENYKNIQKIYKYIGGEVKNVTDNFNNITTNSSNQIKNKGPNIVLLIIIIITSILVLIYFYKLKLHAIIFPLGLMIIFGMVYNLTTNALISGKNLLDNNKNKKKTNEANESIINLLYYTLLDAPNLVPKFPIIPYPPLDKAPFKNIREGIRSVRINYKIDVDKYKISINIPNIEFDFINPLAAICCAWSYFKNLVEKLIETVINPFCNFVLNNIYYPIKNTITKFKNTVIDPIIDSIMSLYNMVTNIWNTISNTFMSAFMTIINILGYVVPSLKDVKTNIEKNKKADKKNKKRKLAEMQAQKIQGMNEMKIKQKAAKKAYNKYAGNIKKLIHTQKQKGGLLKKMNDYKNKTYKKYCNKIDNLVKIKYPHCKITKINSKEIKKNIIKDVDIYLNKTKKNTEKYKNQMNNILLNTENKIKNIKKYEKIYKKIYEKKIKNLDNTNKIIEHNILLLYNEYKNLFKIQKNKKLKIKQIQKINKLKKKLINNFNNLPILNKDINKLKFTNFLNYKNICKIKNNIKNNIQKGGGCKRICAPIAGCKEICTPWGYAEKAIKRIAKELTSPVNSIKDTISDLLNLKSHFERIKNAIKPVTKFLAKIPNYIITFGKLIESIGKKIGEFIPNLFKKIGKILFNIIKIIGWFLKVVVVKGFKLIKAIIDFIIALGKKTTQKISIPEWATTENPILKIPSTLEYVKKIIDLPFKSFFENITKNLNKFGASFKNIGSWFQEIIDGILGAVNTVVNGFLSTIEGLISTIRSIWNRIKSAGCCGMSAADFIPSEVKSGMDSALNFDASDHEISL